MNHTIIKRISRADFQAAIEKGIVNAKLKGEHAEALRQVGVTATTAACGGMYQGDVGCPLVQAGLYIEPGREDNPCGEKEYNPLGEACGFFYAAYDDASASRRVEPEVGRAADILQIID